MADAADLKSAARNRACGFKSHRGHLNAGVFREMDAAAHRITNYRGPSDGESGDQDRGPVAPGLPGATRFNQTAIDSGGRA